MGSNPPTTNLGIRTPDGAESPNVPQWLGFMASDIDTKFGAWTTYSPAVVGFTLGNGTVVGRYTKQGKRVSASVLVTLGTTSAVTATMTVSLPVSSAGTFGSQAMAVGVGQAFIGASFYGLFATPASGTTVLLRTAAGAPIGTSVPAPWVAGSQFSANVTYESLT
jgi:hypothetical protein